VHPKVMNWGIGKGKTIRESLSPELPCLQEVSHDVRHVIPFRKHVHNYL
jgi:hypothetical protein